MTMFDLQSLSFKRVKNYHPFNLKLAEQLWSSLDLFLIFFKRSLFRCLWLDSFRFDFFRTLIRISLISGILRSKLSIRHSDKGLLGALNSAKLSSKLKVTIDSVGCYRFFSFHPPATVFYILVIQRLVYSLIKASSEIVNLFDFQRRLESK